MRPVIIASNLSKRYSFRANHHRGYGLRDMWHQLHGQRSDSFLRHDEFWAVDNVTFLLNPGDSLALIGRNGAGKTTVLKMLAGLLKPDLGCINRRGRMQALINLGAGFNASLSGRENVRVFAALMGLSRRDCLDVVDSAADFAELQSVMDSPVETYSSGMKARLAFAAAVAVRPDILLLDEVLAVGDVGFRNKCLLKLHELKRDGVSFILVSHSHTSIVQFCERALWLEAGQIRQAGPAKQVTKAYINFLEKYRNKQVQKATIESDTRRRWISSDELEDISVELTSSGVPVASIKVHDQLELTIQVRMKKIPDRLRVSLNFLRGDRLLMATLENEIFPGERSIFKQDLRCEVQILDINFNPGHYAVECQLDGFEEIVFQGEICQFVVNSQGKLHWEPVELLYEYEVC